MPDSGGKSVYCWRGFPDLCLECGLRLARSDSLWFETFGVAEPESSGANFSYFDLYSPNKVFEATDEKV